MLTDTERKLLHIIRNYSLTHGKVPPIRELMRMSGRNEAAVLKSLEGLEKKSYIEWPNRSIPDIRVIQTDFFLPKQANQRTYMDW